MTNNMLNTDFQNSLNLSGDQNISPDFNLDAAPLPETTDAIENIDPTGPPGKKAGLSMQDMLNDAVIQNQPVSKPEDFFSDMTKAKGATIQYNNPETVEPFIYQKGFDSQYFDPQDYQQNMQKAIDNETWGTALGKAFDSFKFNFGNTFTGWFAEYPKMVDSLLDTNFADLKGGGEEKQLLDDYYAQQLNMLKNNVFTPAGHEDDIFSKKFFTEFVGNAGFAMGTVGALGLEFAADALVTAATGGYGAPVFEGSILRAGARLGEREAVEAAAKPNMFANMMQGWNNGAKDIEELSKSYDVAKQIEQANAISRVSKTKSIISPLFKDYVNTLFSNVFEIKNSKNAAELVANFAKGTPLLGTGLRSIEKMALAGKNGAEFSHLVGMGLQGGRRLMQEFNMASSEAYFEAVSTYGDTLDKIYKQHVAENGDIAVKADQYENWKTNALDASSANYRTNLGVLLISNHLQFGNLFNKYIPANRFVQEAVESTEENLIKITSKKGLEGVVKKHEWFGTIGSLGKISSEFGKKEAVYQLGKSALKNTLRFEAVEGFQENIQEMTAAGWKDYYAGKVNGVKHTLNDAMIDGLNSQLTKQGLKTWLMGAFTGSLIKIPSRLMNQSMQSFSENLMTQSYKKAGMSDPIASANKRLDNDILMLNTFIKNVKTGNFGDRLFNFTTQTDVAAQHTEAASKGLRYEFENSSDNALLSAAVLANKLGTLDGLVSSIKNTVKDMDEDDFKKQFGIDIKDTKYSSPQEFAEKVGTDLERYAKAIDDFTLAYKTKFENPNKYKPGTREYQMSAYIAHAENEAIHMAALNSVKATMSVERTKKLLGELSNISVLANSSDLAIRVLTNPNMIFAEKGQLMASIKLLNETLKAEGLTDATSKDVKNQIKQKEKQLELLDKWSTYFSTRKILAQREDEESDDETYVFTGKASTSKTKVKSKASGDKVYNYNYDPLHREVFSTFKKLLVSKNKEADINTDIRDSELRDAFEKVVDYMKLDNDAKDYISNVEILTDKEHFKNIVNHIQDGVFKYNHIVYVDTALRSYKLNAHKLMQDLHEKNLAKPITQQMYNDVIKKVEDRLLNHPSYLKLVSLISSEDFGIKDENEAATLRDDVINTIKKTFEDITYDLSKDKVVGEITEQEAKDIIEEKTLDIVRRNDIATKLFKSNGDKKVLTDPELEIYENEDFKVEIDAKIEELKAEHTTTIPVANEEVPVSTGDEEDAGVTDEATRKAIEERIAKRKAQRAANPEPGKTSNENKNEKAGTEKVSNDDVVEYDEHGDPIRNFPLDTFQDLKNALDEGFIDEDDYNSYAPLFLVKDKLLDLNIDKIEDLTETITSIVNSIELNANNKKESFETYFNDPENQKVINNIIKNVVGESNAVNLDTEEEEPVEDGSIIVNNFSSTSPNDINVSVNDINSLSAFFSDLGKNSIITELAALENNVENSEKNVNFVNEEVTQESIFDKLKNNNLEC